MSRNGANIYSKPSGTTAAPNTTIESAKYNSTIDDLVADANLARPIVAGGTGATSALAARFGLGIGHYDTQALLLADSILSYTAGSGKIVVAVGQYIFAGDYTYTVAASAAVDNDTATVGGVKLYEVAWRPFLLSDLMNTDGFAGSILQISLDGDVEPATLVFEEATLDANILTGTTVGHDAYLAASNFPDTNPGWIFSQNLMHSGTKTGNLAQIAFNTVTNTVAFRNKNGSTWSGWQFLWTNIGIETFTQIAGSGDFITPTNGTNNGSGATAAGVADQIKLFPWVPTVDRVVNQVSTIVTTLAVGGLAKFYIYTSDANGNPSVPVFTSADMDYSTTGNKSVTCSFTFKKGIRYWLGLHVNGIAQYNIFQNSATPDLVCATITAAARKCIGRTVTYASGAPNPWTYTVAETTIQNAPFIAFRIA